jgi:hypothetical protein
VQQHCYIALWDAVLLVFARILLPNFAGMIASHGKAPSGGGHGAVVAGVIYFIFERLRQRNQHQS